MNMAYFDPTKRTCSRGLVVFVIGELITSCVFALLMIALMCAPYALGFLPEVEATFIEARQ